MQIATSTFKKAMIYSAILWGSTTHWLTLGFPHSNAKSAASHPAQVLTSAVRTYA